MESITVRPIALNLHADREELNAFLTAHHLKPEADVDVAFGLYGEDDVLCGCGCAAAQILKCFAIDESLRGQNGLGLLISHLMNNRFSAGYDHLFVLTRPSNKTMFTNCGFYPIAETCDVLMLENHRDGVEQFLKRLPAPPADTVDIGTIVMNCNPFTLGHQALIRHAAACCKFLYVFVVEEDRSAFPFAHRIELVRKGTSDIANVCVCPSGPYMISSMTFPTYFLKETESPSVIQSALDITIFGSRIAPALGIRKRFAGTEPLDPVTNAYNRAMERLLPAYGVEFCEFDRMTAGAIPISASRVRTLLQSPETFSQALSLVPLDTQEYLKQRRELYL